MAGVITGIAGLAISAGTTAASFIQAGQQRRKQQQFEADAARALAEARQKLQVNYAEAMSINKEPYNQERLAMLNAGAQITQAAAESERGAAAAAGRILASQQTAQADIANRQGLDMQNIQNAILEEESRLRDVNVGLDVQEIAGQQQAAADARLAADMAKKEGIQNIVNTAQQGLGMVNLYQKDTTEERNAIGNVELTADELSRFGSPELLPLSSSGAPDFRQFQGMSNRDYKKFRRGLTPEQKNILYSNPGYFNSYGNPFNIVNQ